MNMTVRTVHTLRGLGSQVARRHDEPQEVDLVRVRGRDRHGLAVLPGGRVDGDVEVVGVESRGRVASCRLGVRLGGERVAGGRGLAGSDARRVGERDVVVVERAELQDPEDDDAEDRDDERELDHRLASFVSDVDAAAAHECCGPSGTA
jgi:hypothetical protein